MALQWTLDILFSKELTQYLMVHPRCRKKNLTVRPRIVLAGPECRRKEIVRNPICLIYSRELGVIVSLK